MKNSAAFGGSNVSTIFSDASLAVPKNHTVYVRGIGLAGSCHQQFLLDFGPPNIQIRDDHRRAKSREFDGHAHLLALVCQRALDDAGQAKPKRDDIIGLITATSTVPSQSEEHHKDVIRKGSIQQVSARAFAMGVRNSACGAVNSFCLRGPDCTYVSGDGSGLHSLLHGYALLSARTMVSIVVAGVDEPSDVTKAHHHLLYENCQRPEEGGVALVCPIPIQMEDRCVLKIGLLAEGEQALLST